MLNYLYLLYITEPCWQFIFFFFLNDTAPTEIYPLPLPDALPISRQAAVAAGTPYEVTAYGVNQLCGSGLRTVALGYQAIRNGDSEIVVAGGQESMSQAPHCMHLRNGVKMGDAQLVDTMISDGLWDASNVYHMGNTAENVAQRWQITREQQDNFAAASQAKAEAAQKAGRFKDEIVPVTIAGRRGETIVDTDEHPKHGTTVEVL